MNSTSEKREESLEDNENPIKFRVLFNEMLNIIHELIKSLQECQMAKSVNLIASLQNVSVLWRKVKPILHDIIAASSPNSKIELLVHVDKMHSSVQFIETQMQNDSKKDHPDLQKGCELCSATLLKLLAALKKSAVSILSKSSQDSFEKELDQLSPVVEVAKVTDKFKKSVSACEVGQGPKTDVPLTNASMDMQRGFSVLSPITEADSIPLSSSEHSSNAAIVSPFVIPTIGQPLLKEEAEEHRNPSLSRSSSGKSQEMAAKFMAIYPLPEVLKTSKSSQRMSISQSLPKISESLDELQSESTLCKEDQERTSSLKTLEGSIEALNMLIQDVAALPSNQASPLLPSNQASPEIVCDIDEDVLNAAVMVEDDNDSLEAQQTDSVLRRPKLAIQQRRPNSASERKSNWDISPLNVKRGTKSDEPLPKQPSNPVGHSPLHLQSSANPSTSSRSGSSNISSRSSNNSFGRKSRVSADFSSSLSSSRRYRHESLTKLAPIKDDPLLAKIRTLSSTSAEASEKLKDSLRNSELELSAALNEEDAMGRKRIPKLSLTHQRRNSPPKLATLELTCLYKNYDAVAQKTSTAVRMSLSEIRALLDASLNDYFDSMPSLALIPLNNMHEIVVFTSKAFACELGRSNSQFKFKSQVISRKHASIQAKHPSEIFLCDVGSNSGTFVNGQKLQVNETRQLRNCDIIQLGVDYKKKEEESGLLEPRYKSIQMLVVTADILYLPKKLTEHKKSLDYSLSRISKENSKAVSKDSLSQHSTPPVTDEKKSLPKSASSSLIFDPLDKHLSFEVKFPEELQRRKEQLEKQIQQQNALFAMKVKNGGAITEDSTSSIGVFNLRFDYKSLLGKPTISKVLAYTPEDSVSKPLMVLDYKLWNCSITKGRNKISIADGEGSEKYPYLQCPYDVTQDDNNKNLFHVTTLKQKQLAVIEVTGAMKLSLRPSYSTKAYCNLIQEEKPLQTPQFTFAGDFSAGSALFVLKQNTCREQKLVGRLIEKSVGKRRGFKTEVHAKIELDDLGYNDLMLISVAIAMTHKCDEE